MSGFAAIHGPGARGNLEKMIERMAHRGPFVSGMRETENTWLAQNYLRGDLSFLKGHPSKPSVPVESENNDLCICYDGQLDNFGVSEGFFAEEQTLLSLYQQHGKKMFEYMGGGIFALVITEGDCLLAARDLLGIKTMFYGRKDGAMYLASELKGLKAVTDDVNEFPPGHYMDEQGKLTRFASLPESPPEITTDDPMTAAGIVAEIVERSVRSRVDFRCTTASLLSGGLDSSVIATLASRILREKEGQDARLITFAMGVGESLDIKYARLVAERIGSDHNELAVDLDEMLAVLPDVIYYLESFDPSLVRSAVSNYLVSGFAARKGIEVLLSGEGGDEIFCGYSYLKKFPMDELFARQMECIGFLHNNASLRLDRMNHCHGVRVVAPLISGELFDYVNTLPPEYKQRPESGKRIEKWIFRRAFSKLLPSQVVWRGKQEFSQGSGSADVLSAHFEECISDSELAEAKERHPLIRSKEELFYFKLFVNHFGEGKSIDTVGQWISL